MRSAGRALGRKTRGAFEKAFGRDFSGVRVHTGAAADRLTRAAGARAMTDGQHVFFRRGEYSPHTERGRSLLAHELTHTLQQRGNGAGYIQRKVGFEFQSVGATSNVKVAQVKPTKDPAVYQYVGRSSEETLVASFSKDQPRIVSDSGDLEFVFRAVDESDEGMRQMIAQGKKARSSLRGLASAAKDIALQDAPKVAISKKRSKKIHSKFKFAGLLDQAVKKKSERGLKGIRGVTGTDTSDTVESDTVETPSDLAKKLYPEPITILGGLSSTSGKTFHAIRWKSWVDRPLQVPFTPQMTIGVTLENLNAMMSAQLADSKGLGKTLGWGSHEKSSDRAREQMARQLGLIDEWIDKWELSTSKSASGLRGLLKLIGSIVVRARLKALSGSTVDYLKDLAPWMHRTSLGDAFDLLSPDEKKAFSDFRKAKVLEEVSKVKGARSKWSLPKLGHTDSESRARHMDTDKLLSHIQDGRDPFNLVENIGIGEISDSHSASKERFHIDRSTDIGDGPDGKKRQGLIVELRKLGALGGRVKVTTDQIEGYVGGVMKALLSEGWRKKGPKRSRTPLESTSTDTTSTDVSPPPTTGTHTFGRTRMSMSRPMDQRYTFSLPRTQSRSVIGTGLPLSGRTHTSEVHPSRMVRYSRTPTTTQQQDTSVTTAPMPTKLTHAPVPTVSKDTSSDTKVKLPDLGSMPKVIRAPEALRLMDVAVREIQRAHSAGPPKDVDSTQYFRSLEVEARGKLRKIYDDTNEKGRQAIRRAFRTGRFGSLKVDELIGF